MNSLIPKLIVAGLGASVSPVALIFLIAVMFRDHPRRNSLLFLLGYTTVLLGVGIALTTVLHTAGSGKTGSLDSWLDIVLGALCLAAIPLVLKKKPRPGGGVEEQDLKPFKAIASGMTAMLVNSSTWVIYVAGLHMITTADLDFAEYALSISLLTFVTLLTLTIPIALYFIFPSKSKEVLGSVKTWLAAHNKQIGVTMLLIFGAYLLIKGITGLA